VTASRAARRRRLAALVLVALASLAIGSGCGGETAAGLEGTSWRLTGWSANSQDPADFIITAAFADGRIGGKSAVNDYSGPYTEGPGDAFSVGDVASTMMAGPEPEMRAEQMYLDLLGAVTTYKLDGDTLTLFDAGGNESLVFAAATP
jgi:heat shock protein HslJ